MGLLKTVSKISTCLIWDLEVSPSASLVFYAEGENVAPFLTTVSGFALHVPAAGREELLAFLRGLLCMYVQPGLLSPARAVTGRTQPAGARSFDPSVIDARARRYGRVWLCVTQTRAHTHSHIRTGAQSLLYLSLCLTHEVCA